MAQDGLLFPLLTECGRHMSQTTFECGLSDPISNVSSMRLGCVPTCTYSCPLVIGSLRTYFKTRWDSIIMFTIIFLIFAHGHFDNQGFRVHQTFTLTVR